jgi:hypothetical protein
MPRSLAKDAQSALNVTRNSRRRWRTCRARRRLLSTLKRPTGKRSYANPQGEETHSEGWETILSQMLQRGPITSVLTHLRQLASSVANEQRELFTILGQRLEEFVAEFLPRLGDEKRQGLFDLFAVNSYFGRLAASWWLHVTPAG